MGSKKYSLNKDDGKKIGFVLVMAMLAALLTTASQIITEVDFGKWAPVVVPILASLIAAGREWLKDNTIK